MPKPSIQTTLSADTTQAARLRRWVVIVGVVAMVANAGAAAFDAWRSYRQTIGDTRRELENAARILAAQIGDSFRTIDVLLRDTADWYSHGGALTTGRDAIDAALTSRAEGLPQLLRMSISNVDGLQQYSSRQGLVAEPDVSDRSYFVAQRDNPALGLYVSEPLTTRREGRNAIALSRRIIDEAGRFAGVVSGFIDLAALQRFFHDVNLGAHSSIALLREGEGHPTMVVREPDLPDVMGKRISNATYREALESAALVTSSIDGEKRFVAGARVDGFPLVVAVTRKAAAVLDPWREEAMRVAVRTSILSALVALAIAALVEQLRRVERGERALRESEERYALAMEGANEGHFDWHLQGGTSFVSAKMHELIGRTPGSPITTRSEVLTNTDIHPDDRDRIERAFREHLEGRTERYELEYRVRHSDGEWHWLLVRGRCLRDAVGNPQRFVGSAIDITERKRAETEKERLELQLRKSQKMEALGTLAGGVAHDFNNILGAILGYGEIAQKDATEGSALRRCIDNVMHAGARGKALVERILAFSRSGLGERIPVNVQAVAEEAMELLTASLPPGVRVTHKLEAGDAAVMGDATEFHEVFMNLCTNALQAMPDGGELEVGLDTTELRETRGVSHGELAAGRYVRVVVRDTGTGIAPEVVDRIFDPFFTTKPVGQGTGLGLSLVHGIVVDVGGGIDVVSAPGAGTTFTVWLPIVGSARAPARHTSAQAPRGNGEVVMVVDDEPALLALMEEMLAVLGYEPAGFSSGNAALEALAADPQRFDAVVTDEMMAGMSGTALAMEIRHVRPAIPIVIVSGHTGSGVAARALAAGARETLQKPVMSADMAECLARALGDARVTRA